MTMSADATTPDLRALLEEELHLAHGHTSVYPFGGPIHRTGAPRRGLAGASGLLERADAEQLHPAVTLVGDHEVGRGGAVADPDVHRPGLAAAGHECRPEHGAGPRSRFEVVDGDLALVAADRPVRRHGPDLGPVDPHGFASLREPTVSAKPDDWKWGRTPDEQLLSRGVLGSHPLRNAG